MVKVHVLFYWCRIKVMMCPLKNFTLRERKMVYKAVTCPTLLVTCSQFYTIHNRPPPPPLPARGLMKCYVVYFIWLCFSLIVIEAFLFIKSHSNLFLEPTSSEPHHLVYFKYVAHFIVSFHDCCICIIILHIQLFTEDYDLELLSC